MSLNAAAEESLSDAARRRMLTVPGEPLFHANWDHVVMIHYEVEVDALQRCTPFELDLREGKAFVSLVGFRMRRMRPRRGGRIGEWLLKPIATHDFMNVRTYVRVNGEAGICFLTEWLSNRLSVPLGRPFCGLPYRFGRIDFRHDDPQRGICGHVEARAHCIHYHGSGAETHLTTCVRGSLAEFLMERYTAFTAHRRKRRMFRVWHEPWPQLALEVNLTACDLLEATQPWWSAARYIGANCSPGVDVWMGRPQRLMCSRGPVGRSDELLVASPSTPTAT